MTDPAEKPIYPDQPMRQQRPLPLKLIAWVFILWTLLGWLRFSRALSEGDLILSLLSPWLYGYLLLAGLVWGTLGLSVLWGLLRRARWASILLPVAAVIYPALYWIERLLLWQSPQAQRNWPFMLLLTMTWFGLVAWGMRSAHTRAYFNNDIKRR